jgi:hypothetical protein
VNVGRRSAWIALEVNMAREPRKSKENTRSTGTGTGRKDKGDKGLDKFDLTKGADYQVDIQNGGEARDGVKEDRG